MVQTAPSFKLKLFFWTMLGLLSTFFAEVISGSAPFPFFSVWGVLMIVPLYFLHTIVLISIVFRYGKPWFWLLYSAGMLFGMYEAYMTKVLWISFLPEGPPVTFLGVGVIEFFVLVLFWHALFSFIFPVVIGETILTKSRESFQGLPQWLQLWSKKKSFLVVSVLLVGLFTLTNAISFVHTFFALLLSIGIIALFAWIWRRRTKGLQYTMRDLLPSGKQLAILSIILALDYVFTFFAINFDRLPGFVPQLAIWIVYAIIFVLFFRALAVSKTLSYVTTKTSLTSWKRFVQFTGWLIVCTTLMVLILRPTIGEVIFLLNFALVMLLGSTLFIATIWQVFRTSIKQ